MKEIIIQTTKKQDIFNKIINFFNKMNKQIKIEIAVGIILASGLLFGGIYWLQDKNNNSTPMSVNSPVPTSNNKQDQKVLNNKISDSKDCSGIVDFGNNANNNGVFVYSTACYLGTRCSTDSVAIVNYYIRDFEGTFNKKIFTLNKLTSLYFYPNKEKDGFDVISSNAGDRKYFAVSNSGNVTESSNKLKSDENQEVYSANKKKVAKIVDIRRMTGLIIEIHNLENKKVKKYNLKEYFNRMSGMYIDSWSSDDRYVYVAGGMYEFSAPAVLLRIDTEKEKIMQYDKLKDMAYPITIYPGKEVAFVRDSDHFGESGVVDFSTNIFALDLKSGDINKIAKEKGIISSIVASYNNKAYYEVYQSDDDYENGNIKYINISEKTTHEFLKKAVITNPVFKAWSYTFEDNEGVYFSFKQNNQLYISSFENPEQKKLVGTVDLGNCTLNQNGIEYIKDVIAWTK